MVDVNSIATTVQPAASTPALAAVQAAITNLSQNLQTLVQNVQVNAVPTALSSTGDTLVLATAMGSVTVTLAQQMSAVDKQNMVQQLLNMIQAQKPLTLTLQAGSPPTQAVLLLPPPVAQTASTAATSATQTPPIVLPPAAVPLTTGQTVTAVVLPTTAPNSPQQILVQQIADALAALPEAPLSLPPAQPPALGTALPQLSTTPLPPAAPTLQDQPTAVQPTPAMYAPPVAAPQNASPIATPVQIQMQPIAPQAPAPITTQPAAQGLPAVPSELPLQNVPLATAAPIAAPTVTPPLATLLQAGNEVSLQVVSVLPANTTQTPPPLAQNQIAATVTGTGANGNLILQAGDTTLFVKSPVTAPVGSTVILTVGTAKEVSPVTLPPLEISNFPALPQALAVLAQVAPQALQQIMTGHIPQPTENLPGALLFLFSAFKQGNVRGWLGNDAAETLTNAGKANLVASLSRELSNAGQPAQDQVVGEWRAYPIPMFAQMQFQALTLYVHRDRDARQERETADSKAPNKIRFLIDMRLSKLGAMQIDGFVQPKKLDMILRSENNLPDGLHNELRDSYMKAIWAVGYAGALSFQVGRRHWTVMNQAAPKGIVT